jgi:hypothetical protein
MARDPGMSDSKGYHNVHAHITGNGGNGCTTKVCIINRKQHVEGRERGTDNSYRWWCFSCRHRQSCDIAGSQGNCVALRLPLHNCGAMVPTREKENSKTEGKDVYLNFFLI